MVMDFLEFNSSILLTMISINMTIIGLTSLAEKKTIIGVDYGKYLINKYKLLHFIPLYVLLILFALINTVALFTLYWTNSKFSVAIFIGLTVCLSFAIYYFFGFILRENRAVKRQLYENEFVGMYFASDEKPGAECDKIVGMNSGSRSNKRVSSDVVTYFDKFNNDTQKAFAETFGPESIIYKRNWRISRLCKKITDGGLPYDYTGEDDLKHISWEFFQLYRWSELQEKWIMEILVLFNDKYAARSDKMKLNNLIRVFFHINVFGKTENMFGYRVMDYIFKYVKDIYGCDLSKSAPCADRFNKEKYLLRYVCKYIFTCISSYNSEQSYKLADSQLRYLLASAGIPGHISRNDRLKIMLEESVKFNNLHVELLMTTMFNLYQHGLSRVTPMLTVDDAKAIIDKARVIEKPDLISRVELYG